MRGLLDTDILIHGVSIDAAAIPHEVSVSAITFAELSAGVHAASDMRTRADRLDILQRVEAQFAPLPFDLHAARAFGRVSAAIREAGRSPRSRLADQMIAAIAIAHRLPLYTTNADDFIGLEALLDVVAVDRPTNA